MSNILNAIKSTISSSVRVEVKQPVTRSGKTRFPVLVTDASPSFTSGWFIQYNPVAQENGTRLYDGSETFSELHIARFTELKGLVETANYYFLQGYQVEALSGGFKRAIYQPDNRVRLTVTSQKNSVSVVVTITDEASPFHMMSIPFTVIANANGQGYYVIGTDNDRWDRNTDVFKELNANFAPRKGRFYRVRQENNGPATLRAKVALNSSNQFLINYQENTVTVDLKGPSPEYIQTISNEFKALAYIYEQNLMAVAFEKALAQGLPAAAQQQQTPAPGFAPQNNDTFTPAFNIAGGAGAPNPSFQQPQQPAQPNAQVSATPGQPAPQPNQQQQPAPPVNINFQALQPTPEQSQQTSFTPQQNPPANPDALPWDTN